VLQVPKKVKQPFVTIRIRRVRLHLPAGYCVCPSGTGKRAAPVALCTRLPNGSTVVRECRKRQWANRVFCTGATMSRVIGCFITIPAGDRPVCGFTGSFGRSGGRYVFCESGGVGARFLPRRPCVARDARPPLAFARLDFLQNHSPNFTDLHLIDFPRMPFTCRHAWLVRESMKSLNLTQAAKAQSAHATASVIQPVFERRA